MLFRIVIIGAGPAGYFAAQALQSAELVSGFNRGWTGLPLPFFQLILQMLFLLSNLAVRWQALGLPRYVQYLRASLAKSQSSQMSP